MISSNGSHSESRIYLLLIALILIWGLSWPIGKIGMQYMPPLWVAMYRLLIGTVTLFAIVGLLRKHIKPGKKDLKIIFVIGIFQVALFMIFINVGLYYVDAGRAAILVYTTPIWVVPISVIFFNEKYTFIKWIGFIAGIIGIIVLINPFEMDWHNHNVILGNASLLLAAFSWAISILCARYMQWTHTPLELISWQLLVGTIPVVLFTLFKQPHPQIIWNHVLLFSLFYNGVLATAFAYWGTMVISKELPPVTTSLSFLAIPVVGLIFSALLLHESITASIVVAMIFILGGLMCVVLGNHRKTKSIMDMKG